MVMLEAGVSVQSSQIVHLELEHLITRCAKHAQLMDDQLQEAQKCLKDLEIMYNEKLALDAPVRHWERKRNRHKWSTFSLFFLFLVVLGTLGYSAYPLFYATPLGDLNFWRSAQIGAVAVVVLGVGIAVALLRVPLRLAMSQLHLWNDADERVTMVNTYLALRKGEHATAEHMQVVLERLFRPAVDGIVKDELGPVTPSEFIARSIPRT